MCAVSWVREAGLLFKKERDLKITHTQSFSEAEKGDWTIFYTSGLTVLL